jgi:secreted protein with Ig-like and vWFA domain
MCSLISLLRCAGKHVLLLSVLVIVALSSRQQIFKKNKKKNDKPVAAATLSSSDTSVRRLSVQEYLPNNIVFLLDVSNSMGNENKIPLLQKSMENLLEKLRPVDKVSLITFGNTVDELYSTQSFTSADSLKRLIKKIRSTASATNVNGGIDKAYETALKNFSVKGNNEIFLITDGEFKLNKNTVELVMNTGQVRLTGVVVGNNKDALMALNYIRYTLKLNAVQLVSEVTDANALLDNIKKNSLAQVKTN